MCVKTVFSENEIKALIVERKVNIFEMRSILIFSVLFIPFTLFGQAKESKIRCQVRKYEVCAIYDTTASSVKIKILNYRQYLQKGKSIQLSFAKHPKYYPINDQGECGSWLKGDLVYILIDNKISCTIPLKEAFKVRSGVRVCIDLWL